MYEKFSKLADNTHLVKYRNTYKINEFDCGIEEYNQFLYDNAGDLLDKNISSTQLLLDNKTSDIIGYFCLCMSSINIKDNIKVAHKINDIPFKNFPALKIGKLAVSKDYKNKGYGSFLLMLARGLGARIQGLVAFRFIIVDVDTQYNKGNPEFYSKNGFIIISGKERTDNILMYLDIGGETH